MSYEKKFASELASLNTAQKLAVEQIDGPVMVLAGPGTGKTKLLSTRVGKIIQDSAVNPENILCLTFTDSASQNMVKRMAEIFGASAYDVAVHTFHSFAVSAMGRYSDYFFKGAEFQTADELTKLEILNEILRDLPHDNPLSGTRDEKAIKLNDVQKAISNVKRKGGYGAKKLAKIANENLEFINFAEPILAETFADKISIKNIDIYKSGYEKLSKYKNESCQLAQIIINDFADVINDAITSSKTNSITVFKNAYYTTKNSRMKDRSKSENVIALAKVYEQYQAELDARGLYDFDDMIVEIIDKLENNSDFRAEIQEQYQYILVDEFQDTNDAQMKILLLIADSPDSNILVVGDDDQAIYSFQGANVSNIHSFIKRFPNATMVQLYENYRSEEGVLNLAEEVISGSGLRIKSGFFETVSKLLASKEHETNEKIEFVLAKNEIDEAAWVAQEAARELAEDEEREIAIITREHKDLEGLVPYLHHAGITNIEYERKSNVLDSPPIKALTLLSRLICFIADQAYDKANELMPEVLSHPAWEIPAVDIINLSLASGYENRWLELILDKKSTNQLYEIASWLIDTSKDIKNLPMETAIDKIFAHAYKDYYFDNKKLRDDPNEYLGYLSDLITLREKVREYKADLLDLHSFVDVIDLYQKYNQKILSGRDFGDQARVHLTTVHKAKGLEFDTVFMYHGTKDKWLKKSSDKFFPSNIRLTLPHELDENLRLIYVAITRAKHRLFITAPEKSSSKGEDLTVLPVLGSIKNREVKTDSSPIENLETAWNAKYLQIDNDLKTSLAPILANYELNATAVNAFTNLEYAGPEKFFQRNLLQFPESKTPAADYGTAVHETLKFAHQYFNNHSKKPSANEIKAIFTAKLKQMHVANSDYKYYLKKGLDYLPKFIASSNFNKNQLVEQVFKAHVDGMNLTGKMDLVEIDLKTKSVIVTDYKTGDVFEQFNRGKIKTHTYWQQLMFYKLLIENSNNRPGLKIKKGIINFVEAKEGEPKSLEINYDQEDMDEFIKLLKSIWNHIMELDFPDTSEYPKNLKGTLDFENFLCKSY